MPGKYQTLGNIQKTKVDRDWTGTTQGVIPQQKNKSYTDQTLDAFKKLKEAGYNDKAIEYLYETFLVESSGGTDPGAGGNVMQIMPIGFDATKAVGDHPNLPNWYKKYKEDFGIDWNDVTYEQVKNDPFLGVLAARLHVANDPDPIGKTIEDRAKQWSLKYNTPEDAAGDSIYYLNKIKEIQEAYPNIKYQTKGDVDYPEIYNANVEVDAFAKEYVQSENFKQLALNSGYKEKDIEKIIQDIMNFNPDENITYSTDNPSAGTTYNPAFTFPSGEQTQAPGFTDKGVTNINYNPEVGPPVHPFYTIWEQIAGHEGGHLGFMDHNLSKKTRKELKNLIYPGSLDDLYNNLRESGVSRRDAKEAVKHAKDPYEIRANLFQLRYQLHKEGIYNSFNPTSEDNEFNLEHIKQIIDFDEGGNFLKYKDKFKNEMFQFIHPQDIIWMMNNTAQVPEDNLPRVQQGGPIKAQTGLFNNIKKNLAENLFAGYGYRTNKSTSRDKITGAKPGNILGVINRLYKTGVLGEQEEAEWNMEDRIDQQLEQQLFRMYLGQEQSDKFPIFSQSEYIPTQGHKKGDIYYSIPEEHSDYVWGKKNFPDRISLQDWDGKTDILDFLKKQYSNIVTNKEYVVGDYTRGAGRTDDGQLYLSAYDKFDLNPFEQGSDFSFGFGNPQNIYDRFNYTHLNYVNYPDLFTQDDKGIVLKNELIKSTLANREMSQNWDYGKGQWREGYTPKYATKEGGIYQTRGNVQTWRDYTPTLTFPEMPSGEDANMTSIFNWSTQVDNILNESNLSEYHKQLESDYLRKKGGFTNYEHVARERGAPPLVLPYNVKWGSDPSHKQNYIFTKSEGREKEIAKWEESLKLLEGHPLYPVQYVYDDEEEFYESGGNVKRRCSGGRCEDDYPSVTGHYNFDTKETRTQGLEGAPEGTSATLIWGENHPIDVRTLYGKQSYPVAVYADGIYQGILKPNEVLYTDPAMRIDEIPLGYSPTNDVSQYFASQQPTTKTSFRNQYNTELSEEDQILYDIFKEEFKIKDKSEDDMDLKGIFASGDYRELDGFTKEKFRKPNHPLFTKDSKYHEVDGHMGAAFQNGIFEPTKTNMKYNNIDMLLASLSESGGQLALAPYFQEPAPSPINHGEALQKNYEELTEARNLRQVVEHGGEIYNQTENKIKSLVRNNTKLRTELESMNKYKAKMSKYQTQGNVKTTENPLDIFTMYIDPKTGQDYSFKDAYQKLGKWYFKNEDGRDYRVKDDELINQLTDFTNLNTVQNNWDIIYGANDKLKIDLQNPNSWTDKQALAFHKLNQIPGFQKIDNLVPFAQGDNPDMIRNKYDYVQNDWGYSNIVKPGVGATTWLGEMAIPKNINELGLLVGGGAALSKLGKLASKSPRLSKFFGIADDTVKKPPVGIQSSVDEAGIITTTGTPRLGTVTGRSMKTGKRGGQDVYEFKTPVNWEQHGLPWVKNYLKKATNYYRSDEYLDAAMRQLHPGYFNKYGKVLPNKQKIYTHQRSVLKNNINTQIRDMDKNLNITFKNQTENSSGALATFGRKKDGTFDINVYIGDRYNYAKMMNSIKHEINHAFTAAGRFPGRNFGFTTRGPNMFEDVYQIGALNPNHPTRKLYMSNMTSTELNIVPSGAYKGYDMLEVHPSLRGSYRGQKIYYSNEGVPFLGAGDDLMSAPLIEIRTGQELLDDVARQVLQLEKNLVKRMGPKSGWTKKELASFNKEVEAINDVPKIGYNVKSIDPNKNYIYDNKALQNLGEDDWMYLMKPQEQQVRAMTSRDLISSEFPNVKLGDYTDEHVDYLLNRLYKLNSPKTKYIGTNIEHDLVNLYSNLRSAKGEIVEVGSREWVKLIKRHLNKAYGIAATVGAGSQTE